MAHSIDDLLAVMAKLRDPNGGCPWDLEQTFATIAPYTIEEAYEVAEAIQQNDMPALSDELGDLLLQVVFHSRIAEEAGQFTFSDVIENVTSKMLRRHPHVFGDVDIKDAETQTKAWEALKAEERAAKALQKAEPTSALDGVTVGLPALTRAVKLQKRAARVGFDWGNVTPVIEKIREEIGELEVEVVNNDSRQKIAEEYGDLLFVMANLARHLDLDPETALRDANAKFERRFKGIEQRLRDRGQKPEDCNLDQLDAEWNAVKATERSAS